MGNGAAKRPRPWLPWTLYSLVVALAFLGIFEFGLLALSHKPQWIGAWGPRDALRSVYMQRRSVIQSEPDCAHWDAELSYILRPGTCTFDNLEFTTEYRINSAGLRDDEASLDGPEVIVVGDSHAMGWGVEQEQNFAALLEDSTGLKVLNAAISSYGTARELALLGRLDTSRLRLLIVQYGQNDFAENEAYLGSGRQFEQRPPQRFQTAVADHRANRRYRPGMYLASWLRSGQEPVGMTPAPKRDRREATNFLDVLIGNPALPPGVPVLVFEINGYARNDDGFSRALEQLLATRQLDRRIEVLKVADLLGPGDYFVLDDHLASAGHRRLASAIEAHLAGLLPN